MYLFKIVILAVLCLKTSASFLITLDQNSCLKRSLNELVKDAESLAISWSHSIDHGIRDEISKLLLGKINFITNPQLEPTTTVYVEHNSNTVIILASKEADIVGGMSSLYNKNSQSIISKLIVVYLDKSGNERKSSTDPFFHSVFRTLTNWSALNVHFIYKFNDKYDLFSWFSYKDNDYNTVCECESGFYQNCRKTPMKMDNSNAFERKPTITVAVQSYEPYSFYSKDSGFGKGVEIDLVKEFARQSHFNLELNVIDKMNYSEQSELNERYVHFPISLSSRSLK